MKMEVQTRGLTGYSKIYLGGGEAATWEGRGDGGRPGQVGQGMKFVSAGLTVPVPLEMPVMPVVDWSVR